METPLDTFGRICYLFLRIILAVLIGVPAALAVIYVIGVWIIFWLYSTRDIIAHLYRSASSSGLL